MEFVKEIDQTAVAKINAKENAPSEIASTLIDNQKRLNRIDNYMENNAMRILCEGMRGELQRVYQELNAIRALLEDKN